MQATIVIIAKEHNPSIINPDFLSMNGIVMNEWGWEVHSEKIIITPELVHIPYNDADLNVQRNSLTISVHDYSNSHLKLIEFVKNYVSTLPHISYLQIGNNFGDLVMFDSDEKLHTLKASLFPKTAPLIGEYSLINPEFKFGIRLDDCVVNLKMKIDSFENRDTSEHKDGLVLSANFHREIKADNLQISECVDKLISDHKQFSEFIEKVIS